MCLDTYCQHYLICSFNVNYDDSFFSSSSFYLSIIVLTFIKSPFWLLSREGVPDLYCILISCRILDGAERADDNRTEHAQFDCDYPVEVAQSCWEFG